MKNNLLFIDLNSNLPFDSLNYTDGLHLSIKGNILVSNLVKMSLKIIFNSIPLKFLKFH